MAGTRLVLMRLAYYNVENLSVLKFKLKPKLPLYPSLFKCNYSAGQHLPYIEIITSLQSLLLSRKHCKILKMTLQFF